MSRTNTRSLLLVLVVTILTGAWLVAPRLSTAVTSAGTNADKVDGFDAVGAAASAGKRKGKLVATNRRTGLLPNNIIKKAPDANKLDGKDSSAFAVTAHRHAGGDITTGTVAEARLDALIARDSEIMPTVLGADGAGSGLDADLLDGQSASAFALASHGHDDLYYTKTAADARYERAHLKLVFDGLLMQTIGAATLGTSNSCAAFTTTSGSGFLPLTLPLGYRLMAVQVAMYDGSSAEPYSVNLHRRTVDTSGMDFTSAGSFSGGAQSIATVTHDMNLAGVETIDANESFVLFVSLGTTAFANGLCLVTADVLPPA